MRSLLAAILLPLLLLGCLDAARGMAPMVVVTSAFEITGEGQASRFTSLPCPTLASYATDPARVTLLRTPLPQGDRMHIDFVLVRDFGTDWRPWVENGSLPSQALALTASSGGGPLPFPPPWPGGKSAFGVEPPFASEAYASRVRWSDEKAWLDDTHLVEGQPLQRSYAYQVTEPHVDLAIKETLTFTYVGKARVTVDAPSETCDAFT